MIRLRQIAAQVPFTVTVNAGQPGLLGPSIFNIGGTHYLGALFSDAVTYVRPPGAISGLTSRRAKLGDMITLYGIGLRPSRYIPPGQIAEGNSTLAASLTVSFGGARATTTYDGLVPMFVGLYQFNVVVPAVAAIDTAPIALPLSGVSGTHNLSIAIGN